MITLLPRLPALAAERLLETYLSSWQQWPGFDAHTLPEAARFGPTGGSPISSADLQNIRAGILDIATKNGHGHSDKASRGELSQFDAQAAAWLADQRVLASGEALRDDVWAFIAIVAVPDIATWRFGTSPERYYGGVRNTFQRLWMRGKLFDRGPASPERWGLLDELTEDALVQITERPSLSGNPVLARAIAEAWVRASAHHGKGSMESLTRRAVAQIRARNEVRCLDELPCKDLADVLDGIFGTPAAMLSDRAVSEDTRVATAAQRLQDEAKRWGLLSPKSTDALQSILSLNFNLTSSERNSLNYLIQRIENIGLLEAEIKILRALSR